MKIFRLKSSGITVAIKPSHILEATEILTRNGIVQSYSCLKPSNFHPTTGLIKTTHYYRIYLKNKNFIQQ